MRWPRNDSDILGRGIVRTVGSGLSVILIPSCGYISFGFGPVVAVPGVLVHRVEGHATGLYGPRPGGGGAHDMPSDIKSASLEKFFPPWTVRRQIWTDALKPCHSGVSTDVLLFIDINISLVHHYRVFKRGLLHIAFRKDYLMCLRVFVLQATAMAQCDMASPVPTSSVSARHARSSEVEPESPGRQDVPVAGCGLLMFVTNLC